MSKFVKVFVVALLVIILIPFVFLAYIHFNDFKPEELSSLELSVKTDRLIETQNKFSLISWNIGYCGLGKEMDFFYDGGTRVRADKKLTQKYINQNLNFICSNDSVDFWFFQEVDQDSKRTYSINQVEKIQQKLQNYNSVYVLNYDVSFVPMPLTNPLGKIKAGMMTLSKFLSVEQSRYAYPNIAAWPEKLFLLDRCLILTRYTLPSGKDLVLINTHNSYFVDEDSLRMIELNVMKKVMTAEYAKGNYVVAGGDWNKYPPGFLAKPTIEINLLQENVKELKADFLPPDWQYIYDADVFSNRDLLAPLNVQTKFAVIDFFVLSPNIKADTVKCIDLGFKNSDHNPVKLEFHLVNQ